MPRSISTIERVRQETLKEEKSTQKRWWVFLAVGYVIILAYLMLR